MTLRRKLSVLLRTMRIEPVDPENRIVDATPDGIETDGARNRRDAAHTRQRA